MFRASSQLAVGSLLLGLFTLACGEDVGVRQGAATALSGAIEAPSKPQAAAGHPAKQLPTIFRARFEPEEPTSETELLRVVVETSEEATASHFFHYTWKVDGEDRVGAGPELAIAELSRGQQVEVAVSLNDGVRSGPTSSLDATIANSAPRLLAVELNPADTTIAVGSEVAVRVEVADRDGDDLSVDYVWTVDGNEVRGRDEILPPRRIKRGHEIQVAVTASDGRAKSEVFESEVWTVANTAPRIVSTPPDRSSQDGTFRYPVRAEDSDGDTQFQFTLQDAPLGMTVGESSGVVEWAPATDQVGKHNLVVLVSDQHGGSTAQEIEINVQQPAAGESSPASAGL